MNDKYMTLFSKTNTQLEKELHRRGFKHCTVVNDLANEQKICRTGCYMTPKRAIAEIIYKDAFDAGRSLKMKEATEEKTYDYLIEDDASCCYKVSLTMSQIRLLNWLDDYEMLGHTNYESFNQKRYEDVGRI